MQHLTFSFALVTVLSWLGCSSNPKSSVKEPVSLGGGSSKSATDYDQTELSRGLSIMTYSASNNAATSFTVDKRRAGRVASDLQGDLTKASLKDRHKFLGLMAAKRISGGNLQEIIAIARRLVNLEIQKSIDREAPDILYLELALAAFQSRDPTMAEFFLRLPLKSRDSLVKASALNLMGVMATQDNRLPEAIVFWNEALKVRSSFKPAKLNIGFAALKYGDHKVARRSLSNYQGEWYPLSGLIVAERLAGSSRTAKAFCSRLKSKNSKYKPALFSCALNEYQGLNNLAAAKESLRKLAQAGGGFASLDEKAYLVIGQIEKEERRIQNARTTSAGKKTLPVKEQK